MGLITTGAKADSLVGVTDGTVSSPNLFAGALTPSGTGSGDAAFTEVTSLKGVIRMGPSSLRNPYP